MKRLLKRVSTLFSALVLGCTLLSALANDNLTISLKPEFGLFNGTIHEYVFDTNNKNTDNMESRLDWDIQNIPYIGINAEINLVKYIYLDFYGIYSIPGKSGKMQDYDWLNSVTGKWKNDDPTETTNYSCHTNYLNNYFKLNYRLGVNFNLPLDFLLTPFIEYDYSFIYFDGLNGYNKYKSNNYAIKEFTVQDKVIAYKQEENTFLLGVKLQNNYLSRFIFKGSFALSPNSTYITCLDYHYVKRYDDSGKWIGGVLYYDDVQSAFQLKADLAAQFIFNKFHSAGLSASLNYVPVSKGVTKDKLLDKEGNVISDNWSTESSNYKGGTSRFIWSVALSYTFTL